MSKSPNYQLSIEAINEKEWRKKIKIEGQTKKGIFFIEKWNLSSSFFWWLELLLKPQIYWRFWPKALIVIPPLKLWEKQLICLRVSATLLMLVSILNKHHSILINSLCHQFESLEEACEKLDASLSIAIEDIDCVPCKKLIDEEYILDFDAFRTGIRPLQRIVTDPILRNVCKYEYPITLEFVLICLH